MGATTTLRFSSPVLPAGPNAAVGSATLLWGLEDPEAKYSTIENGLVTGSWIDPWVNHLSVPHIKTGPGQTACLVINTCNGLCHLLLQPMQTKGSQTTNILVNSIVEDYLLHIHSLAQSHRTAEYAQTYGSKEFKAPHQSKLLWALPPSPGA